jgi:hypothetical protein
MSTITKFISDSDNVLLEIMTALEPYLELPAGTFAKLHNREQLSGSESRVITKPAAAERGHLPEQETKDGQKSASIGAHTDFGSCASPLRQFRRVSLTNPDENSLDASSSRYRWFTSPAAGHHQMAIYQASSWTSRLQRRRHPLSVHIFSFSSDQLVDDGDVSGVLGRHLQE